jgi:hypothetical protein
MGKSNDNTGSDFVDHQKVLDQAKNERIKKEQGSDKIDPEQANNPANRNHKTDLSQKKTGGGKQSSPGD